MPQNKQRQIVDDLGIPAPLQPIAVPGESYVRPDVKAIGAPPQVNGLMQLGAALSTLSPALTRYIAVQAPIDAEKAYAEAATEFYGPNRQAWMDAARAGTIPEGANPYFVRAISRLSLQTEANEFPEYLFKAYQDGVGGAKDSDDPNVLRKFMMDTQSEFVKSKRGNYNNLDVNEVLFPALQKAEKSLHGYHTNYRIQEHEKAGEQTVGMATGGILARWYVDHKSEESLTEIGTEINKMLRDNLSGVVPNGMRGSKANEIVIDRVIQDAVAVGDPFMAQAILSHVTTNGGKNNLAELPYAKGKLEVAKHAIIDYNHKRETIAEWENDRDYRARVKEHNTDTMKWADDTHARTLTTQSREDKAREGLSYGMYLLSHPDPKGEWKAKLEKTEQELEALSPQDGAWLRNFQHTTMKVKADVIESPENTRTISQIALDMARNPMAFDERRLAAAVEGRVISTGTFLSQMGELVKERRAGENPLMSGTPFTAMLHRVEKGVQKQRDAEFDPKVTADITDAITEMRVNARAWIEKNPQGGPAAFEEAMRVAARDVTERYSTTNEEVAAKEFARKPEPAKAEKPSIFSDPEATPHVNKQKPAAKLDYKALKSLVPDETQADIMKTYTRMTTPAPGEMRATERDLQRVLIKAYAPFYDKTQMAEMMKMVDETMAQFKKMKPSKKE